MEHARPPTELVVEGGPVARAEAWRKWRKQFEVFLKASGVSKEPSDVQASLLVNLIGPSGYEVFSTFTYGPGKSESDLQCLLDKFDAHFGTKPNITMSRFKFFSRNQDAGETIDQFVTALRLLSQTCDFGELSDSLIKDRIVCGISSNIVRDRLLRTDDLNLARAVQICEAAELSKEERNCIQGGSEVAETRVDALDSARGGYGGPWARAGGRRGRRGGRGRPPARGRGGAQPPMYLGDTCSCCGYTRCLGGERCAASYSVCFVCNEKGHFAKVCSRRGVLREKVLNINVQDNCDDDELFYVDMLRVANKSHKEWIEVLSCNGKNFQCKLDTGSMLNVISKTQFSDLGLQLSILRQFNKRVHSFTGNEVPILGETNLLVVFKNKTYTITFVVADFDCQNVLGLEACNMLNCIKRIDSVNLDKFGDLFQGLGMLPGRYSITVDSNVQPIICPARKVPLGLREKLHSELQKMIDMGVIRKVTHPTNWVNAIVLAAKKNGDIRICLDPRPLNRAIRRPHYTLPTVTEIATRLRGASFFSILDARSGFWMVQLDDASADLCTFSTPFGRYQFLRLPYGISCASEVFHAKIRQYLEDLEGTDSFIDDIIVWGKTKQEHDTRLEGLLQKSKEIGLKYNKDKCKFGVREVVYLGHIFDENGMRPDKTKIQAIVGMPYPTDRKALERFLGMVNYLSKFIQNYSESVAVLRNLLKKDSEWIWEKHHSNAVDKLKDKLCMAPVLAIYSLELPVVLSVDASSEALGAALLQAARPVEFASLTLTDTQRRYAQIEKEMLAIVFACERFHQYIFGRSDVTIHSDHKPLEALFKKALVSVPARLQRMMLRIQGYNIKVIYTPGKYMYIADTLSRAPLTAQMHERVSEEVEAQTGFLIDNLQYSTSRLEKIKQALKHDDQATLLIKYTIQGWPKNKYQVHDEMAEFWPFRECFHVVDGLIFRDSQLFIPRELRDDMLERVHEGHLGIDRCKRRAREVMYWPGMSRDVERRVRACRACAEHAQRPPREPLLQHHVPDLPWCKLASDIFECRKKYYVILVDYFSNYVEVDEVTNIGSKAVIAAFKRQFARHGIPNELVTDNGPAYSSAEFKQFMCDWEIKHTTSSPHYPQSNGKSERTVKTIKCMLKKCLDSGHDFQLSLLNYRSTPRDGMDSPAQILMGRRLNTRLPIHDSLLYPNNMSKNKQNHQVLTAKKQKQKDDYDKGFSRELRPIFPGEKVTLKDDNKAGKQVTVVSKDYRPRSYILEDAVGRRVSRNRRQIIARNVSDTDAKPSTSGSQSAAGDESAASVKREQIPNVPVAAPSELKNALNIKGPITRSKARLLSALLGNNPPPDPVL